VDIYPYGLRQESILVDFTGLFWITTVIKLIALILGSFIVYLAYKGYRRNAAKPLLYTSLGFGLITAGTILEGILYVILGEDLLPAITAGTIITVLGFVAIIFSIYSVNAPTRVIGKAAAASTTSAPSMRNGGEHE
jgi:uncharacterized membrane protein YdjX (TVP38/TMEM64 family)